MKKPEKVVGVYERPAGSHRTRTAAIVAAVVMAVAGVILLLAA